MATSIILGHERAIKQDDGGFQDESSAALRIPFLTSRPASCDSAAESPCRVSDNSLAVVAGFDRSTVFERGGSRQLSTSTGLLGLGLVNNWTQGYAVRESSLQVRLFGQVVSLVGAQADTAFSPGIELEHHLGAGSQAQQDGVTWQVVAGSQIMLRYSASGLSRGSLGLELKLSASTDAWSAALVTVLPMVITSHSADGAVGDALDMPGAYPYSKARFDPSLELRLSYKPVVVALRWRGSPAGEYTPSGGLSVGVEF